MGLCDAAGCDMADIADAMLADAAAALPGVEGGARADGNGIGRTRLTGPWPAARSSVGLQSKHTGKKAATDP